MDPLTSQPRTCIPSVINSCQATGGAIYTCTPNFRGDGNYYCCGSASSGLCPTGKVPYRDPTSQQPQRCQISSVVNTCPSTYSCQSSISTTGVAIAVGYCCTNDPVCPGGGQFETLSTGLLVGQAGGTTPRRCTMGIANGCSAGFTCQRASRTSTSPTGYCCNGVAGPDPSLVCSQGSARLLNGQAQDCILGIANNCPSPTDLCLRYSGNGRYYCCQQTGVPSSGCPASLPVLSSTNPTCVLGAVFGAPGSCPTGFSCQFTSGGARCCGPQGATSSACAAGQTAEMIGGQPRSCQLGQVGGCSLGYSCQFTPSQRLLCCGVKGGCPGTGVAYIGTNGAPQPCLQVGAVCAPGYSCQQGSLGLICCTSGAIATTCAAGQVLVGSVCLAQVAPNSRCQANQQCLGGSSCLNGVCSCPAGTVANGVTCQTVAPGSSRLIHIQPQIFHSHAP